MACALLELLVCLCQQGRRARDEEPHRAAVFPIEARFRQQPCVKRRHTHHYSRTRQAFKYLSHIEPWQHQHPCSAKECCVRRDE